MIGKNDRDEFNMPSPLAHVTAGYALYHLCVSASGRNTNPKKFPRTALLLITIGLSLLPDLDFLPGFFSGDYDRFHNTFSNSLVTGLVFALIIWIISLLLRIPRPTFWFLLSLVSYELHVIMDFFTWGRGTMLLWPFSENRFEPAVYLFYGLHRSDGLVSIRHLWTLITELAFALGVILLIWLLYRVKNMGNGLSNLEVSRPSLED